MPIFQMDAQGFQAALLGLQAQGSQPAQSVTYDVTYGGWTSSLASSLATIAYPAPTPAPRITTYGMISNAIGYSIWWPSALGGASTATTQPPETEAQRLERQARSAARRTAKQRAEKLLFTILTPTQVKRYTDDGSFETEVNGRIYRIRSGRSRNVELIEAGKPTVAYCAHPADAYDLPIPDVMLSQLLMLRADEAEFIRIANRTVL